MYMYLNDQLIAEHEAKISIFDHGYLYGVGLFETFRTYQGVPFLLERHLDRLRLGCQEIGLIWEPNQKSLEQQITTLLHKNDLKDGYFRLNVSAGAQPIGLPSGPYEQVTEALFVKGLPISSNGAKRLVTLGLPRNTPEGTRRYKSHHYLNNILGKQQTPLGAEGVFLTSTGYVAEGVVSNLFFVRDGKLYTPALETGILDGITRAYVLELAKNLGIETEEGLYPLKFAQQADEVFITNSIQEIVPVAEWDDISFKPMDYVRTVARQLQDHYRKKTEE